MVDRGPPRRRGHAATLRGARPNEPAVVVPVFDTEPDTGFGVDLGAGWAVPGLITGLRKPG
ncbi:MAG: hypothetical protein ACRDTG_22785 [Pseudonocardiaceae bacterium]